MTVPMGGGHGNRPKIGFRTAREEAERERNLRAYNRDDKLSNIYDELIRRLKRIFPRDVEMISKIDHEQYTCNVTMSRGENGRIGIYVGMNQYENSGYISINGRDKGKIDRIYASQHIDDIASDEDVVQKIEDLVYKVFSEDK